jgi:hypothetical protein
MRPRAYVILSLSAMAAAVALLGCSPREVRISATRGPQVVTLPHGEQFRLAGVTYGTNHVWGSTAIRLANQLPPRVAIPMRKYLEKRFGLRATYHQTPVPTPVVWFEYCGTAGAKSPRSGSGFVYSMLADENDVMIGDRRYGPGFHDLPPNPMRDYGPGYVFSTNGPQMLEFHLIPKRCRTLQCVLFEDGSRSYSEVGRVRFSNPAFGRFPQWKAEPLPVSKKADDLQATLTSSKTGVWISTMDPGPVYGSATHFRRARLGETPQAVFSIEFTSPHGTNEEWQVCSADLTDATGNRTRALSLYRFPDTHELGLGPALWPGESAWRLRLDVALSHAREPEEVVTFRDVPVPPVGSGLGGARGSYGQAFLTNIVDGLPVVVAQRIFRANSLVGRTEMAGITAELPQKPDGYVVRFERVTGGPDWTPQLNGVFPADYSSTVNLIIPSSISTVDVSWVVLKTRRLEYLVRPPPP